jgi:signal transduction histidine kinase
VEDFDILGREEILGCLTELKTAARAGHQLLENLLDLSLLKGGMLHPAPAVVHLESLLYKVRSVVVGLATRKNIRIQITGAEPLTLFADPRLAMSIFQNLLSNAVKFTPPNGLVEVGCAREADEVVVRIRDNGAGIDPITLDHLNAGESVGTSKGTAGETGAGWGLRICREFCRLCDARLSFASPGDTGTTCVVRFRGPAD